jgi:hypothetical protein
VHGARSALHTFVTPCLRPKLEPELPEFYHWAREHAKCALYDIDQISLGESLPETRPSTFDQILDEDWWPVWADKPALRDQP